MKKITSLLTITLITILFFTEGCKKAATSNPQVVGNLFGFVTLYDQYGGKITSGLNTATINLYTPQGTTLNAVPDTLGRYQYNNIVQGQYLISFSCPGYGSIVNAELGFLGEGSIDHDVKLSAIPNFTDSILWIPTDTGGNVVLQGVFSGSDTQKRTYAVFAGATSAVSSAPANYLNYYSGTANSNLTTFTLKIPVSDLNNLGFSSGSTVYFAAYGAAADFASSSDVEDYANTGRLNFTALSSSAATTSFVLP